MTKDRGAHITMNPVIRILGLGNDILGDDAVGARVCEQMRRYVPSGVDIVSTSECGFALLEYLEGVDRLLVIDAMLTGRHSPGTVLRLDIKPNRAPNDDGFGKLTGNSPHFTGIVEPYLLVRELGLRAPEQIVILAVEVADAFTVGGGMDPRVVAATELLTNMAKEIVHGWIEHP